VRRLVPILAVQFIGTLGFSIALPILVFVVRDFGGAAWTYGVVAATYSFFQLFGAPILGRWSDRIGRRRVLLISLVGTLAGWLLFLLAFWLPKVALARVAGASLTLPLLVVFAARAGDGLTGGNVSVANAYLADLTAGEEEGRQRAFGFMGMAASSGFAVGPAIAGVLGLTPLGYAAPVMAAAIVSALAALVCLRLPDPPAPGPERRVGATRAGPPPQTTVTKVLGQEQRRCDRMPTPLREVAHVPRGARRLIVATFALFFAFNLFYAVFPVRADLTLGFRPGELGALYTTLSLGLIVVEGPLLAAAAKRFAPGRLFAFGMLCLGLAFVGFTTRALPTIFASAGLFALGNGLAWPTFQARIAGAADAGAQGVLQGVATGASSLASIAGLIAGSALYRPFGAWLFVAGAALFVALALLTRPLFGPARAPRLLAP
jgi:MFS family permease